MLLPEDLPANTAALAAAVTVAFVAVFSGLSSLSNSAASAHVEVASTPHRMRSVAATLVASTG